MKDTIHKVMRRATEVRKRVQQKCGSWRKGKKEVPPESLNHSEHPKRKKAGIDIFLHSDRDVYWGGLGTMKERDTKGEILGKKANKGTGKVLFFSVFFMSFKTTTQCIKYALNIHPLLWLWFLINRVVHIGNTCE